MRSEFHFSLPITRVNLTKIILFLILNFFTSKLWNMTGLYSIISSSFCTPWASCMYGAGWEVVLVTWKSEFCTSPKLGAHLHTKEPHSLGRMG